MFLCVLALPETEAPHLGVSSGGVEVEGVFAKFAGKHLGIEQLGMANFKLNVSRAI